MDSPIKQVPVPNGSDFTDTDSLAKADARLQRGELEKMLFLPAEFGGTRDPRNVVYVPVGFVAVKSDIDRNIIKPLAAQGKITKYQASPEHQDRSFIPIAIMIVASSPGSFATTINIWGKALTRRADA
jgi:hypothetical protein